MPDSKFSLNEMLPGVELGDEPDELEQLDGTDTPTEETEEAEPEVETKADEGEPEPAEEPAKPNPLENEVVKEQNRYITHLERERAEMRSELQRIRGEFEQIKNKPAEPYTVDADTFLTDPTGSIKKMGYISEREAQQIAEASVSRALEQDRMTAITKSPDFAKYRDTMRDLAMQYPDVDQLRPSVALTLLMELAKAKEAKPSGQPQVQPSDPEKRERASTAGGRGKSGANKRTDKAEPNWDSMSPEEIEKTIGFSQD